jgi:hypothetical protein
MGSGLHLIEASHGFWKPFNKQLRVIWNRGQIAVVQKPEVQQNAIDRRD